MVGRGTKETMTKLDIPFVAITQSGISVKHGNVISAENLSSVLGVKVSYLKDLISENIPYFSDKMIPYNIAYLISDAILGADGAEEIIPKLCEKIDQYKEWLKNEKSNLK